MFGQQRDRRSSRSPSYGSSRNATSEIEELESSLEGDIDLRGFLGLSNEVRRGYRSIRVNFRVKTAEENIERLKALSKLSPVFDVTSNGTDISVNIERK